MHPGFDPKSLTDDDLLNREMDLTKKLVWANQFSLDGNIVSQIQMVLMAIRAERAERMFQHVIGQRMVAADPVIVETEPDLRKPVEVDQKHRVRPAVSPGTRPIERRGTVKKTSQPVVNGLADDTNKG